MALLGMVTACDRPLVSVSANTVNGIWSYSRTFTISGTSCTEGGSMSLTDNGSAITGNYSFSGQCTGDAAPYSQAGSLTGTRTNNNVVIQATMTGVGGTGWKFGRMWSSCDLTGTLVIVPNKVINGSATCTVPQQVGGNVTSTGTWQATSNFR